MSETRELVICLQNIPYITSPTTTTSESVWDVSTDLKKNNFMIYILKAMYHVSTKTSGKNSILFVDNISLPIMFSCWCLVDHFFRMENDEKKLPMSCSKAVVISNIFVLILFASLSWGMIYSFFVGFLNKKLIVRKLNHVFIVYTTLAVHTGTKISRSRQQPRKSSCHSLSSKSPNRSYSAFYASQ